TRLRRFRKTIKLTQAEFVTYLDIGRANLSRIEKGEIFPSLNILVDLRNKFNLSIEWVVFDKGEMLVKDGPVETIYTGENKEEIRDLLYYIGEIPAFEHAVLAFFHGYRARNEDILKMKKKV
ncbi:MAG: helix-turn-helix transcriptional regulator, partial [bacterium]|nr:helix-turn-helix transcriptional regulator [bacterium]